MPSHLDGVEMRLVRRRGTTGSIELADRPILRPGTQAKGPIDWEAAFPPRALDIIIFGVFSAAVAAIAAGDAAHPSLGREKQRETVQPLILGKQHPWISC
jgi:hypothetical protein